MLSIFAANSENAVGAQALGKEILQQKLDKEMTVATFNFQSHTICSYNLLTYLEHEAFCKRLKIRGFSKEITFKVEDYKAEEENILENRNLCRNNFFLCFH